MPSGLAKLGPHRCVVITHQKGRDTKENVKRNFGCAHPEGYRKALRLMRLAEKIRAAGHFVDRHAGRISGHRLGGAPHLGSDRGESARDDDVARADYRGGHRRRRLGRRARDRRGGPRAHSRERLLFGDQSGSLLGDFVEGSQARAGSGRSVEIDGGGFDAARRGG